MPSYYNMKTPSQPNINTGVVKMLEKRFGPAGPGTIKEQKERLIAKFAAEQQGKSIKGGRTRRRRRRYRHRSRRTISKNIY